MAYEIEERHGAGESGEIRNRSVRPDKWKSSCFPFLTIADRRPMVTRLCQPRKPISIFFPGHFHLSIETYDTFDHRRFLTAKIKKVPFNLSFVHFGKFLLTKKEFSFTDTKKKKKRRGVERFFQSQRRRSIRFLLLLIVALR